MHMKTSLKMTLGAVLWTAMFLQPATLLAQGTAFTYQGRLDAGGAPYTGTAEFQPTLWDAASGGSQIATNTPAQVVVSVTNGLFVLPLDFGVNFPGADRWLQLEVRTALGPFTLLTPRQKLTPAPYAITANHLSGSLPATRLSGPLPSANLVGTYSEALTFDNPANSFRGSGAGLTALNASELTSGSVPAAALGNTWKSSGNAGTTAGTHFLGTTDNQPLEIKVNSLRALRLEPTPTGAPNLIAGAPVNFVAAGVVGATIAGGGATNYFGSASTNWVLSDFGVLGGGRQNTIATGALAATIAGGDQNDIAQNAPYSAIGGGHDNNVATNAQSATIAGGYFNDIAQNAPYSAIGGGVDNNIEANSSHATIAGGFVNDIGQNAAYSVIGGGSDNNIAEGSEYATIAGGSNNNLGTNADYSAIGGGRSNLITANAAYATIPGGQFNTATNYAFAAGRRAKANHTGAFVWGDATDANIASTNANSMTFRASGGVRFFSNTNATAGVFLAPGGTSWAAISDRNAKKNFAAVDVRAILEKLAALPVQRWNYVWEDDTAVPHLGPMAQDFKGAFFPGRDDKSITTQEADGVALAAIQGLNQKVEAKTRELGARSEELEARSRKLEAENAALKAELKQIKQLLDSLASQLNGGAQ